MAEIASHYNFVLESIEGPPLTVMERDEKMQAFQNGLLHMIQKPPANSDIYRALGKALFIELSDDDFPLIRQTTEDLINLRRTMPADQQVTLLRITLQHAIGSVFDLHSMLPDLEDKNTWRRLFRKVLPNPNIYATIYDALSMNANQANIPQRYAGPKIAIKTFLGEEIGSLVDSGTSAGLGLTQLKHNIDFDPIEFSADNLTIQTLKTQMAGRLLIKNAVGFDSIPPPDSLWVESCSEQLKVDRLEKSQKRKELYNLGRNNRVLLGNIAGNKDELKEVREKTPDGKFDVVMALTSLYELPRLRRKIEEKKQSLSRHALDNLEGLTRDDGIIIVQDFAKKNPKDPSNLLFKSDIYAKDSRYRLFTKRPGEEWLELGEWDSGRCRIFTPSQKFIGLLSLSNLTD